MTTAPVRSTDADIYSCDLDSVWIWTPGHVSRSKMRGIGLSKRPYLDADVEVEQILRAKVRRGWVLTIDGEGDAWACGADFVTYFETEEPEVADGKWIGHTVLVDSETGEEEERDSTVYDGPHEATWLEIR